MLSGSLDAFALPDVLRFVAGSGSTGRIEINRDEVGGELSLDQGRFVAARLTGEDAPTTVDEAMDVAVLLFDGTAGSFEVVHEDWAGGPLNLDADELVAAVDKRRQEWAEVVSILGSLEEPLVLAADLPPGADQITIRADQWKMLTLVDGCRTVQDIARDGASSVYSTALALAELAERGMVARGVGVQWQAPAAAKRAKKAEENPVADAAEMLHELGGDEGDDAEDAEPAAEGPKQAVRATVRPLRVPTREEQRIKLRR
jgi:hypothetical protein